MACPPSRPWPRTTHMAISAHQDDIEIMAAEPILAVLPAAKTTGSPAWWSPTGAALRATACTQNYTDEEMRLVRFKEQKKAAIVGEYAAQVLLDYPSKAIKDGADRQPVEDLAALLQAARPQFVYTHNLADKHDTHVGVALKVIAAIRSLPEPSAPAEAVRLRGVARPGLDGRHRQSALRPEPARKPAGGAAGRVRFADRGGKRYDLATMGRRRANATYFESHGTDTTLGLSFGMDLTPLITHPEQNVAAFVQEHIARFAQDVAARLERLGL